MHRAQERLLIPTPIRPQRRRLRETCPAKPPRDRTRNLPFFVSKSAWHSDVNALDSNIVITGDDQNVRVLGEPPP